MKWHRELVANVLKFQRDVTDAKLGFVLYTGDLFSGNRALRRTTFQRYL